MKNNPFIGREGEFQQLSNLLKRGTSSLVVVKGRLGIGKSRLIKEFTARMKGYQFCCFNALSPNPPTTALDQRENFAQQLSKVFSIPLPRADNWSVLFWMLADQVKSGKYIIVLDEISWMATKDPSFSESFKIIWDTHFSSIPKLMLILCGSHTSWIDNNILRHAGLSERINLEIFLKELSLSECKQFWGEGKTSSAFEKYKILSVTGGVPKYLSEIDPQLSAEDNIYSLCFDSKGMLFREFDHLFDHLFRKRKDLYQEIIKAIAKRKIGIDQLHGKLGRQASGVISQYVDELENCGLITRDYTWILKSGKRAKFFHLRICDNYLRFYLNGIAPHRTSIENNKYRSFNLERILGQQFENLILNNRETIWDRIGISKEDIVCENPFFQRSTKRQKGCQIDYLIQTRQKTLYICEIKFLKRPVDSNIISDVQGKLIK